MSAHFSSAPHSRHSSLHQNTKRPPLRVFMYLLISLSLSALLIVSAEGHARSVEYMRSFGISVEGLVTDTGTVSVGGRTPSYYISGEYAALSPSGIELQLPFRFTVTAEEFKTYAEGNTLALIYDPDRKDDPQITAEVDLVDTAGMRGVALITAAVYALLGIGLSVFDWRRLSRSSKRESKLRSAFGTR
ncbi:MAG: hypothetical protein IPK52_12215 [Chloroflexi bacterium]|nr:hypothetical protein [Chloroflexota bacterium]